MADTPFRHDNQNAGNHRVLVVDDDNLQRGEIMDYLSRQGIEVSGEDNGFAAVHEIKRSQPKVVVMDMKMPGLDGLHVSRLVSKLDNPPRVILMSGFPEYVYRAHAEDTEIFSRCWRSRCPWRPWFASSTTP